MISSYAVVRGNVVENVIRLTPGSLYEPPEGTSLYAYEGSISPGWFWNDGSPSPPLMDDAPIPNSITRRQLLLTLQANGIITGQEALAAAQTGAVPAIIQSYFANLPEGDKLNAEITWASMAVCERSHPLVVGIAAQLNLTEQQVDDFFRQAYHL